MAHPLYLLVAIPFPFFGWQAIRLGTFLGHLSHPISKDPAVAERQARYDTYAKWTFLFIFTAAGVAVAVFLSLSP